jgi:hypothetical protein
LRGLGTGIPQTIQVGRSLLVDVRQCRDGPMIVIDPSSSGRIALLYNVMRHLKGIFFWSLGREAPVFCEPVEQSVAAVL